MGQDVEQGGWPKSCCMPWAQGGLRVCTTPTVTVLSGHWAQTFANKNGICVS